MGLQLDDIRALMQDLENSSMREFSLQSDDFTLHLSKNEITQPVVTTPAQPTVASVATAEAPVAKEPHPLDKEQKQGVTIDAPLVGTVYLKANPDAAPFKQVGDHVAVGEQVAIVEAMKLMTPVKSEVAGVITEILVEEEDVVDYAHAIFRVKLDA